MRRFTLLRQIIYADFRDTDEVFITLPPSFTVLKIKDLKKISRSRGRSIFLLFFFMYCLVIWGGALYFIIGLTDWHSNPMSSYYLPFEGGSYNDLPREFPASILVWAGAILFGIEGLRLLGFLRWFTKRSPS